MSWAARVMSKLVEKLPRSVDFHMWCTTALLDFSPGMSTKSILNVVGSSLVFTTNTCIPLADLPE